MLPITLYQTSCQEEDEVGVAAPEGEVEQEEETVGAEEEEEQLEEQQYQQVGG